MQLAHSKKMGIFGILNSRAFHTCAVGICESSGLASGGKNVKPTWAKKLRFRRKVGKFSLYKCPLFLLIFAYHLYVFVHCDQTTGATNKCRPCTESSWIEDFKNTNLAIYHQVTSKAIYLRLFVDIAVLSTEVGTFARNITLQEKQKTFCGLLDGLFRLFCMIL